MLREPTMPLFPGPAQVLSLAGKVFDFLFMRGESLGMRLALQ